MSQTHHTTRPAPDTAVLPKQTGAPIQRICQGSCKKPIPAARLAAQPNARMCVPCLEAAGDVPVIKRFDETTGDGEQLQTFFTKDRRIETEMLHRNKVIASQQNFDYAVGDDSHLGKEANEIIDGGRSLSTIFDDPEDAPSLQGINGRRLAAAKLAQSLVPNTDFVVLHFAKPVSHNTSKAA